jgi:hypothetical protein
VQGKHFPFDRTIQSPGARANPVMVL